jgi:membrane protease YdiL (CAAX protease family)
MKHTLKILLITLISFGLYFIISKIYFYKLDEFLTKSVGISIIGFLLTYIIVGLPLLLGLFLIHKPNDILNSVGLRKGFLKGLLFSFLITLPMLIGYSVFLNFNRHISINSIFVGVISAAFFEELYFRGIFFGQIFRYTKIGFIPSIVICALFFASGHMWQSNDISTLISIFIITFLGAGLFAWLYIEWDNNLWVPMGLHLFMNLHWDLFSGANALGGKYENLFRAITIILAIVGTLQFKKHKGLKLNINKTNLIINPFNVIWTRLGGYVFTRTL